MEIKVEADVLSLNNNIAAENEKLLKANNVYTINVMGSPGAGKTTLLEKTIDFLAGEIALGVIEGDIYTAKDAQRIEKHGIPVKQINTGGSCHLDGRMVQGALKAFDLASLELMIIENVGNLVCPVEFNLGEDLKIAVLSITEGEDKPMKYPLIFKESGVAVLNKIDIIPMTDVNMEALRRDILSINPEIKIFEVSCRTGEGMESWVNWLKSVIKKN